MNNVPGLMGSSPTSGVISPAMTAMQGLSSAGSGLMGAVSSPTTLGSLQAGTSVLSGLGTMAAYNGRASSDEIQAGEWRTQASNEFGMAQNQLTGLKAQYLNDIGALTTKAAAGGIDVGAGAPAQARSTIAGNAVSTGQVDLLASDIRARRDNINAIQADAAAKEAQDAGGLALVGGILGGGLKLLSGGVA